MPTFMDYQVGQKQVKPSGKPWPHEQKVMTHLGYMAYYAHYGMLDPTNLADIPAWKKAGYSTPAAVGLMTARALLGGMVLGYIFDPHDIRPGGVWEWRFRNTPKGRKTAHRHYWGSRQI